MPSVPVEETILAAFVDLTALGEQYLDDFAEALSPGLRRGTAQPLIRLYRGGTRRVTALARELGLDSTTVTRHLDELERRGLVARTPDPSDRRASLVRLTRQALTQLDAAEAERRRRLRHVLTDWSASDRQAFARLLTRFAAQPSLAGAGAGRG